MNYVFQNIFWCLLAAAVLGGLIGWWLKKLSTGVNLAGVEKIWRGKVAEAEASWQARFGPLQAERDKVAVALKTSEADVTSWKTKFSALESDFAKTQANLTGAQWRVSSLETTVNATSAAASKLSDEVRACTEARSLLEVQLHECVQTIIALEAEKDRLIGESHAAVHPVRADLEAKLNESIAAADVEDDATYETQIAALNLKVERLRAELETGASRFAALEVEKSSAEARLAEAEQRFSLAEAGYRDRIGELEGSLARAISDDEADDRAYEARISALTGDVARLTDELDSAGRANKEAEDRWLAKLEQVERDNGNLRASLGDLETRLSAAEESHRLRADELTRALASADQSRSEFETLARNSAVEAQQAHDRVVVGLRAEIEEMANQISAATSKAVESERENRVKAAAYESEIERLKASLKESDTMLAEAAAKQTENSAREEGDRLRNATVVSELRTRIGELEAAAAATAAAKPMLTMAAAATTGGAGSTAGEGRYDALKTKFDSFVVRMQKDGYGDIERIEGIGPIYGQKLRAIGIAWVRELLEQGGSREGRARIVQESGIDRAMILSWVNAADLLRIDTITPDFAELLEASGVDTVRELRTRVPENLQAKLVAVNSEKRLSKQQPTVEQVAYWVATARLLPVKVSH